MEWLKNHWAHAKSGDKSARRKLLALAVAATISVALLISGQTSAGPIKVSPKEKTSVAMQSGYVHVSGAVKNPGVYPITTGIRMFELIALAGGFTSSADRDSVNLARLLTDGEQIVVSGSGGKAVNDGLVHLNRATAEDLDKLPGIGPTLSQRIIDWRTANGNFQSVDDLRRVGGIGDKLFSGLRQLVVL